jgi:hypothetical protein
MEHCIRLLFSLRGLSLLALFFFSGCKTKTWEVVDVKKNITGADPTASIYQIEAYIYNIYIGLTGRKPTSAEFASARQSLIASQANRVARGSFIRQIVSMDEFYYNLYNLMRKDLLEDADTSEISYEYSVALGRLSDTIYASSWPRYLEIKKQYEDIMRIPQDLKDTTIGMTGLYRRGTDNDLYDQINMGSENFIVSCFTFYLGRYPTFEELESGKKMVDSRQAVFFLQNGANKQDFLDIFFSSPHYKEGLIRRLFKRFLYREPNAAELEKYLVNLAEDQAYQELFVALFSSDEYYRQQ